MRGGYVLLVFPVIPVCANLRVADPAWNSDAMFFLNALDLLDS